MAKRYAQGLRASVNVSMELSSATPGVIAGAIKGVLCCFSPTHLLAH